MRRVVVLGVVAVTVAVAVVAVARWERERHADEQNAGIDRVHEAVGALDAETLEGFRMLQDFQCLIYRANGRKFGLELCVDWDGRVVEAIDRRDGVQIWSLREDPELTRVRVDRDRFERVIVAMCEECRGIFRRTRASRGHAR